MSLKNIMNSTSCKDVGRHLSVGLIAAASLTAASLMAPAHANTTIELDNQAKATAFVLRLTEEPKASQSKVIKVAVAAHVCRAGGGKAVAGTCVCPHGKTWNYSVKACVKKKRQGTGN